MSRHILRTFIAIELAAPLQESLKDIQDELMNSGADVKWVKPDNIHLTLKFLGDVSAERIDSLIGIIDEVVSNEKSFTFRMTHIGAFPKPEHPKIIWAGITLGKENIERIVSGLEERLQSIGFEKKARDFFAHVTLGRVRSCANRLALSESLQNFSFPQGLTQKAKQTILFKSTLTPDGPIYKALMRFDLKQENGD